MHDIEIQADERERLREEQECIEIIDRFQAAGIKFVIDPEDGTIFYHTAADQEKGEAIIQDIEERGKMDG